MKKRIYLLLVICLLAALTACGSGSTDEQSGDSQAAGSQTAQAYLDQDTDTPSVVTVDLSGGWSVEYARGAVYLYDGPAGVDVPSVAMLNSLDKNVYEEYIEQANADENKTEADGGIYFTLYEDEGAYITSVDDAAYFLITSTDADAIKDIVARFTLALE